MKPESPFNALPALAIALSLLIIGIEAIFQLADFGIIGGARGLGWRGVAINEYAYSPLVFDRVVEGADYSFGMLKRFVTYTFVYANNQLTAVVFCAALTLALGKFTVEYYGTWKVAALYLATSIVGAVTFGLLVDGGMPLLGGFVPVYGLIGAYTYALWLRLGEAGENQILAFRLIGFLLVLQLIFGLIFGGGKQWIAELSGFATGFLLSTILAPGGWKSLVTRMRQRS